MTQVVQVTAQESDAQLDPSVGSNFTQQSGDGDRVTRVQLDGEKQAQSDEGQKPAGGEKLIFGKYKTLDEAERAFKGLESRIGQQSQDKPKEQSQGTPKIEVKDFDWSDVAKDFSKDGKVSEGSYAKAAEKGLSKADVDNYVTAQKAITDKYVSDLAQVVGGQENLNTLVEWAKANLTQKQAKAIQSALDSMDLDQATLALEGLNARYIAKTGKDPELVGGESKGSRSGVQPFRDMDEVTRAMSDSRYRTSAAYQKEVEQRMAAMEGGVSVRVV